MNKYYTPEIEEFHVGFEFEVNYTDEGWLKEIFCNGTGKNIDSIAKLVSFLGRTNFEDAYRVKYLDKEDIESLRFEQLYLPYEFKKDWYRLIKQHEEHHYIITDDRCQDHIFVGIIKNKSELKKLLKQLNVN
jgi:hypothetical protein